MTINYQQKGVILLITFLTLSILFVLGSYLLVFTVTDRKISGSQESGTNTYYLAEAGINDAVWKLKNDNITSDGDEAWEDDFIDPNKNPYPDGSYWQATFSRTIGVDSYQTTIKNTSQGRGEIISTATSPIPGGGTSRRVVKTTVFKALASPVQNNSVSTGV